MAPIICSAPLLAHQGGWDEILLVGVPILMIVVLLAIAKRRVEAQVAGHGTADSSHTEPDQPTVDNGNNEPGDA